MSVQLFIIGCGAQGRVVLDIMRAQFPEAIIYFVDDNQAKWGSKINGIEVIGGIDSISLADKRPMVHVAIGNPYIKAKIIERLVSENFEFINAIHPSSVIMDSCRLGHGIMIGPGVVVNSDTSIGNFCVLNTNSIVEHDCVVEDYVGISPLACIGGRVTLQRNSFIAMGAIVKARLTIGSNSVVGIGSIVLNDVKESVVVFGNPARVIQTIDADFKWENIF